MAIDNSLNDFIGTVSGFMFDVILYSVPFMGHDVKLLIVALALSALFFTVYFGFINIRLFGHAIDIVRGRFDKGGDTGHISSWQALMTSMSGTVGLGNIAGVAVALSLGGAGAVFWMVALGFLSMSTKFVEVTLGVKYRQVTIDEDGQEHIAGGPMYYLQNAFDHFNIPFAGRIFTIFFAICCVIGSIGGAVLFQSNQVFEQLLNVSGGAEGSVLSGMGWAFGVFMAVIVAVVIIGGITSISHVASRLVPMMGALYAAACLFVIFSNIGALPSAFAAIFDGAFSMEAGLGGLLGAMMTGFQRAAFSNESGLGTASIVYAATKGDSPIRQGIASMLGPFLDTVIICSLTAFMILTSGAFDPDAVGVQGIVLTSSALEQGGASWMPYLLALVVFLFAYSTIIAFYYVSAKAFAFVFGTNGWLNAGYKIFYCLCAVLGSAAQLGSLIDFTDAAFLSMFIPNLVGLILMAHVVKADLHYYLDHLKK